MTTPPLQPGQYWRTRSGEIRYVAAVMPKWMNDDMPVLVVFRRENGDYENEWYRPDGGYFVDGISDKDLITHLPECDSLDWVPVDYPVYVMDANESLHYAYIRRDSEKSAVVVYTDGRTEPYKWDDESQGFIDGGARVYITKEQAESRVHRPDPPTPPSHHTAPEVFSLIEKADKMNELRFANTLHGTVKLLIRICSAQQSMLSELSSKVDALRSEITSGGAKCQKE